MTETSSKPAPTTVADPTPDPVPDPAPCPGAVAHPARGGEATAGERLPRSAVTVWATAQKDSRGQRRGRYTPETVRHPAKMLPAIAAHAITHYTEPGERVFDPMCGIGTTLVEAVHAGRDAFGVEYEATWSRIARNSLALAASQGAPGTGHVITADARRLPDPVPVELHGRFALVLTSPPYGPSTHGQVRSSRETGQAGVHKWAYRYSERRDPANLAHAGLDRLIDSFTRILAGCAPLLRPGGHVVVTARPWRSAGELVDLPSAVIAAGRAAGLQPVERCVALLAGLRGDGLVPRPSFFQRDNVAKARAAGLPLHLIIHEDVLVFRVPANSTSSGNLKDPHPEPPDAAPVPAAPLAPRPGARAPVPAQRTPRSADAGLGAHAEPDTPATGPRPEGIHRT